MSRHFCTLLKTVCLAALTAAAMPLAHSAQPYPSKPVRIILPHSPGSSPDMVARLVAEKLGEQLGQPFVIENRTGAGGSIGLGAAAKAAPDGYTLTVGHVGTLTINPSVYAKLPYDPAKDFTPIMLSARTPLLVVVAADSPYKSIADVIAAAKAQPGKLMFSSAGNGTASHMAAEYFDEETGISMVHVPFKSASEALTGVASGAVTLTFGGQPAAWPLVKAGKLRALALTSGERVDEFPDTPVIAETVKGYEMFDWSGFMAPAGTPDDIIALLHKHIAAILAEPDMVRRLRQAGLLPMPNTPGQFGEFIASERAKWGRVAKEVNIHLD
ncbi:tripartite tricarboxylate transporter substrate binding protein [Bordetella sp. BOR01]|uniref:Bug family tripartite tricarboxylate transporter substrate binding protein n=1 Tax=Bordetella sp. BOR01 TaxID=2854779 RepID=UPI001C43AE65|nr:tripartite tricarboxylate transporter substrate binding protein [Bordetella sp. BOR01]MBV7482968.1 tripartite tricarboxylate transporter substrate binding protein [Bordetella sp. BOR01]